MIPGQDPMQMVNPEEPSLKRRYNREPEAAPAPIQFKMEPAFDAEEEQGSLTEAQQQAFHQAAGYQQQSQYLDDEDDDIFPGGPAESQILSWKKQFNNRVYSIELNEDFFVFRTLTRYEYKQIVSLPNIDPLMREEIICETCVLWPLGITWQNVADLDAGLPAMVSENILDKSGFTKNIRVNIL